MGTRTRVKTQGTEASGLRWGPGCGVILARAGTPVLCIIPLTAAGCAPSFSMVRSLGRGTSWRQSLPFVSGWRPPFSALALSRPSALHAPHRPVGILGHMGVVACAAHLEVFKQAAFALGRSMAFVPDAKGQRPGAIRDP